MLHIDIKKLGRFDRIGHRITGDRTDQSNSRGIGWEFVHVAIDDASRVALSRVLSDEKQSALAFLEAARMGLRPRAYPHSNRRTAELHRYNWTAPKLTSKLNRQSVASPSPRTTCWGSTSSLGDRSLTSAPGIPLVRKETRSAKRPSSPEG